jgi:hypothetical protein
LDGSGVLVSVVGAPAARRYQTLAPIGFLLLILLLATPVLGWIIGPFLYAVRYVVFRGLA